MYTALGSTSSDHDLHTLYKRQHSFHTPHGQNIQAKAALSITHSHTLQPGPYHTAELHRYGTTDPCHSAGGNKRGGYPDKTGGGGELKA